MPRRPASGRGGATPARTGTASAPAPAEPAPEAEAGHHPGTGRLTDKPGSHGRCGGGLLDQVLSGRPPVLRSAGVGDARGGPRPAAGDRADARPGRGRPAAGRPRRPPSGPASGGRPGPAGRACRGRRRPRRRRPRTRAAWRRAWVPPSPPLRGRGAVGPPTSPIDAGRRRCMLAGRKHQPRRDRGVASLRSASSKWRSSARQTPLALGDNEASSSVGQERGS